jgi:type IV fimbrial biogenesis protein FimT
MRCLKPKAMPMLGVTLIELAVVLAMLAITAAIALPAFAGYLANAQLREAGNMLLSDVLFAQSEAIKRNGIVRVSIAGNGITVSDRTTATSATLRQHPLPGDVTAENATIDFASQGWTNDLLDRTIALGRPSVACGDAVRCPALRVEAGGAVRLCGDKRNCS